MEDGVREIFTDDFGHVDPSAEDLVEKIDGLRWTGKVSIEKSRDAQYSLDGKKLLYPERWQVICGVPRGVAERFAESKWEAVLAMYLHLRPDDGY